MNTCNNLKLTKLAASILLVTLGSAAQATEGGGGVYPNGNENYMAGALPPPGTYYLTYASHYQASTLRDNSGNRIPLDFDVQADALALRVVHVTEQKIFGGQLLFHAVAPLVNLKVRVGGSNDSSSGLADMVFGTGLGYHASDKLHYVWAVDVTAPTGSYDSNKMANLSRNYWNIEPVFALTYVQPSGFNADVKVMYDFNGINRATNYRSGQELHADYSAGWALGNGWTVGVGGFVYRQITDDQQNGATVANNKGRAYAIGPSIKYDSGKGWFLTAKFEKESGVVNRAEGSTFRIKALLPF
ncbi:transporter [Rhodoferax sp.]|uniref:SphA family protein n=1 Tax=Rhodoferax sp. TaxID=50421 RepID=UPI0025CC2B87|nr:transporter [Rhodoferax sp.]MCM2339738.1 transporter [Rhodoferax sp.]